jgi:hypothetical protein
VSTGPAADVLVLDDRAAPPAGPLPWRFFSDGVMGGVSQGRLSLETVDGRAAVCLQGEVRLENNGGFIQIALDVPPTALAGRADWTAVELDLLGNGRRYGVHLRTTALSLPWQSYRAAVEATPRWQRVRLPFAGFAPYRTAAPFEVGALRRLGVLAIGERFDARVCVGRVALVR